MKKNTSIYHFKNEELEQQIAQEHALLLNRSRELGAEHAQLSQPKSKAKPKAYLGEIEHGYESLGHSVKKTLQSELHESELDAKDEIYEENIKNCEAEIKDLGNEVRLKKNEVQKTDNTLLQKNSRWRWFRIAIFAIVLCDIVISAGAIQQMRYSLITSFILGATIGVCILLISEHLNRIIGLGKTKTAKKVIAISLFTFLFLVFLTLGYFRSLGIKDDSFSSSPLAFALIQSFFLLTASAVSILNKPTPAEYKQIDFYLTQEQESLSLERKLKNTQAEKQQIQLEKKELEDAKRKLIQYHKDLLLQINSYWKKAYQEYCSVNMFSRADGIIPEFFNKEAKNLSFTPKTN